VARTFRLYEKKRGNRRTGSKKLGSIGEALFFAVFLIVGCAASALMLSRLVIPEFRANRQFVESTCTVLAKDIAEVRASDGVHYRPDVTIRYQAGRDTQDATTYDITRTSFTDRQQAQAVLDRYDLGQPYACWYDPMNPDRAVLERGYSGWLYMLLLIPISFVAIGTGGLIYTLSHWGTSTERRATLTQKAAQVDLFEMAAADSNDFPHVPRDANLRNSPGTTLAYRLPIALAPGWRLFAAFAACLSWNAIVGLFAVMAVRSHVEGNPNWMLTVFVVPFVLVGLWLVYHLVREILATTGVGPTRVEISHHPLRPGQQYDVLIAQSGHLSMNSLEIVLACDERATYRQGTDTRTESCRIYEDRVFLRESFEILPGVPFSDQCRIRVPEAAMHSFKSDHNEINWKLVVRGHVTGWPDYERVFPVVVYPLGNGNPGA